MSFGIIDFLRWFRPYRRLERENARLRGSLQDEVSRLTRELDRELKNSAEWRRFFPPGHFYSPMPSQEEVAEAFTRGGFGPPFGGIDLNEKGQFALLESFVADYKVQPFPENKTEGRRFFLANDSYGHFDAIMLYCMLRHARPRRIIEVGSGLSSAAMLDIDEFALGGKVDFTFIDPDMTRVRPLLREADATRVNLIPQRVQEVPLATFAALAENDVLFIDSSHVSKVGSDVNRLFFDILPVLAPGVLIHIHDITGSLEYPRDWFENGRVWNEQYLLRAFLMHNEHYRVELFTSWLYNAHHAWLSEHLPLCVRGGGGQMWLRKLAR